ncbi:MAG: hypothetical protein AAFX06_31620 [Planctomycetota bacterium]
MRKTVATVALLTVLFGGLAYTRVVADESKGDATAELEDENPIVTIVYKWKGLPVYDKAGNWKPDALMHLIQVVVSPKDWEANGGSSTMAPYPQNQSIIISTTMKNHKALRKMLERVSTKRS